MRPGPLKEQSSHAEGELTCNYNRSEEEFLQDWKSFCFFLDFYQHIHTPFDTCKRGFPAERQTQLNLTEDWMKSTDGSWRSTTNNNDCVKKINQTSGSESATADNSITFDHVWCSAWPHDTSCTERPRGHGGS